MYSFGPGIGVGDGVTVGRGREVEVGEETARTVGVAGELALQALKPINTISRQQASARFIF